MTPCGRYRLMYRTSLLHYSCQKKSTQGNSKEATIMKLSDIALFTAGLTGMALILQGQGNLGLAIILLAGAFILSDQMPRKK